MTNGADVFFDSDRIRVVEELDVAADETSSPTVELSPRPPSVTVRGAGPEDPGAVSLSDSQGDRTPVRLTEDTGAGALTLTAGDTGPAIRFDARSDRDTLPDPEVALSDGGRRLSSIKPGRVNLLFEAEFPGLVLDGSGEVSLTNRQASPAGGRESCLLDGEDSALVLSTTPEAPRGDQGAQSAYGGGELLVQSETAAEADIHIHAQGERDSEYGVRVGNRPRILLHGPQATLDVGRHRLGSDRPAREGSAVVRSEYGETALEMRADESGESVVVFEYVGGSTTPNDRGAIRSHRDGLMIYDAGGHEALLLTDSGTVETRKGVTENADI